VDKLLLTAEETAQVLGIGRTKVYELVAAGRIASVKIDACRGIPAEAVRAYVLALSGDAA
jgi:excisionase family DNA binding protein